MILVNGSGVEIYLTYFQGGQLRINLVYNTGVNPFSL